MPYADFSYYTDVFGGKQIAEVDFTSLARKASYIIDRATRGNIVELNESVKDCCCAIAEILQNQNISVNEQGSTGIITSESVGGHSVSYKASSLKSFDDLIYEMILLYLGGTGLLSLVTEYKRGFNNEN